MHVLLSMRWFKGNGSVTGIYAVKESVKITHKNWGKYFGETFERRSLCNLITIQDGRVCYCMRINLFYLREE